ncbi:hypothetical protein M0R45_030913 [Rubus argutus]|uniref:Uncharacterized protein n=1 Tax=Rubus argutus TaxID=59490 RepID=A0AAW1WCD8_RUBAR
MNTAWQSTVWQLDTDSRRRTRQSTGDGEEIDDGIWAVAERMTTKGIGIDGDAMVSEMRSCWARRSSYGNPGWHLFLGRFGLMAEQRRREARRGLGTSKIDGGVVASWWVSEHGLTVVDCLVVNWRWLLAVEV